MEKAHFYAIMIVTLQYFLIVLKRIFLSNGKIKPVITHKQSDHFPAHWYEKEAHRLNTILCGVDESGRGCLGGPVVAAAVILKYRTRHPLIKDSKILTPQELEDAYRWIVKNCIFATGIIHNRIIDEINIYQATLWAMHRAVMQVSAQINRLPDTIVVDAMPLTINYGEGSIFHFPRGEKRSHSIAAASIIAKVTRDRLVHTLSPSFPAYKINEHKGYATALHRSVLQDQGATIMHRHSFSGVFTEEVIE